MCRSHAVHGAWRARCTATTQITHSLCHSPMLVACESAERGKRERKKRGWQLIHSLSLHRTSSWHTPFISSPSLSSPLHILLFHTHHLCSHHHLHLICLTTHSTPLLLSLNPSLLTHTHTRPKPHPIHVPVHRGNTAAAAAAAPLLVFLTSTTSSPCPPPPACHTCTHKQQVVHV